MLTSAARRKQEESTEVRRTHPSLPTASSCHDGCVLWKTPGHLARTTKGTLSHRQSIPQQIQFFSNRAVLSIQPQIYSLETQPLYPETLKPVPLKQNSRVLHFQRSEFQAEHFHNKLVIFQGVQSTTIHFYSRRIKTGKSLKLGFPIYHHHHF